MAAEELAGGSIGPGDGLFEFVDDGEVAGLGEVDVVVAFGGVVVVESFGGVSCLVEGFGVDGGHGFIC